ncbi:DNA-binding protein [Meridianimaribacter sp. CL38]|uniref:helix-turn-helix domain-containing protein n=1 Tax=Meridianimaribacter sp. CL38 TaxID=2213021 RepID=UPI00103A5587|nr:helix-turn-helix domain-containing protein [Meridianimaribacter sp. CL38]TBV27920.1 DNA-binding protein [Meridianimaribacter sp. CL38]
MESKEIRVYNLSPDEFKESIRSIVKELLPQQKKNTDKIPFADELLTVEETLKFLKCSKQALWNWRKNGILPSYRLGNRVYYKRSDIFNKLIKQV